jgi:hypothetical protein
LAAAAAAVAAGGIGVTMTAGCHNDADHTPVWQGVVTHQKPAPPVKKGPTVDEQTAGMVAAASTGKSDVPVGLKFDLAERPTVGRPLAIDIALLPRLAADSGTLQVTESPGMDLATGAVDIPAVQPDEVYRTRLSVTPNREGVLFLALAVTLKHDEISERRDFTLPIIAGAAAGAAPAVAPVSK